MKRAPEHENESKGLDYHDYVFKDGKFVGRFEEMYRDVSEPWPQQKEVDSFRYRLVRAYLQGRDIRTIIDVGCGFGYFADSLRSLGRVIGLDISPTAAARGRCLHPGVEFLAADVKDPLPFKIGADAVVALQLLWYVADNVHAVLANLAGALRPGGSFITSLYMPENPVGKEYIAGPQQLIDIISGHFKIEEVLDYPYFPEEAREAMDLNRAHHNVYIFASGK